MAATVDVNLQVDRAVDIPVHVEILSPALEAIVSAWQPTGRSQTYAAMPGLCTVRARLSSGAVKQQTVIVPQDGFAQCQLPLHDLSPHESNEWAYFTQPIDPRGQYLFTHRRYRGASASLWVKSAPNSWKPMIPDEHYKCSGDHHPDGVVLNLRTPDSPQTAFCVGGPNIPAKFILLPPRTTQILLRPAAPTPGRTHPLEVVPSTEDIRAETLLAFLNRGDLEQAELFVGILGNSPNDASDSVAFNIVHDYWLLRRPFVPNERRFRSIESNGHRGAEADAAIIQAWQALNARKRGERNDEAAQFAYRHLIDSIKLGLPLYTEGLRLLRDGLRLIEGHDKYDPEIDRASYFVNSYFDAADHSAPTTTCTGLMPDRPDTALRKRQKKLWHRFERYIFDVPLDAALEVGLLQPGDTLQTTIAPLVTLRVRWGGVLELDDGRRFANLATLAAALSELRLGDPFYWISTSRKETIFHLTRSLRLGG